MLRRYSSKKNLSKGSLILLLLLIGASLISYAQYGPYYSPDTVNYFDFSQNIFKDSFWKQIYSPLYPFLLRCLSALPFLSIYDAAHLLILFQYGLGAYFFYLWANTTAIHYGFGRKKQLIFLLLVLLSLHSWWSFRIITWAHADATFYCLLIIWLYYITQYHLKSRFQHLLIVSLLGAAMIWVKLNALALIPFYFLLFIFGTKTKKWLVPLCCTLISYLGYRYLFQQTLIVKGTQTGTDISSYFSQEGVSILSNNLAELFKTTLGFILSDALTAFIPYGIALAGGILILLSLLFMAAVEINKRLSLSSISLVFGLVYLLCQLAFQQLIGFEEMNYRTLFPYFLGCSWYVWVKVAGMGTKRNTLALILCLLMVSHTLAGHFWLWKRKEVNSLFEVERLEHSAMMEKIIGLHHGSFRGAVFVSDRPEKLALLLKDPYVVHYHPDFVFVQGKRRPVADQEKQINWEAIEEQLLKGMAVVVIFGEDERLISFAEENGVLVLKYPEGTVLHQK